MFFQKQTPDMDLGDTPIANIFINDFMPIADGTFVKVYLLGYMYAHDKDSSLSVNHETIAKNLNIVLSDVLRAWDFWEQKEVIKKKYLSEDDPTQYIVEFMCLKQLIIKKTLGHRDTEPTDNFTSQPNDLIEAKRNPRINEMFLNINQIMGRSLVPGELLKVLDWYYNYSMSTEVIIRAFMHCIQEKNIKKLNYIEKVIISWYDQGITTMEKLDDFLERTDERNFQYVSILKYLGIYNRLPTHPEKETMKKWFDVWNFPASIIFKACDESIKIRNPNIDYIDGVLENYKKVGIKALQDLEKQKLEITKAPVHKKQTKPANNRFHNFKQPTLNYTNEELENLLRNKK